MRTAKTKKKIAISVFALILLVAAVLIAGYFYARPNMWMRVNPSAAYLDGEAITNVGIFRSSAGNILISSNEYLYVYFPESQQLGLPNGDQFFHFGSLVLSKDPRPPVVWGTNRVKVTTDPNLVVSENGIEFTTSKNQRLKVQF